MFDERALRRPGFRPGIPIRLSDQQEWVFPGPEELLAPVWGNEDVPPGELGESPPPPYQALLSAVVEAEDVSERRRAELALGIYLLDYNYMLSPDGYRRLLESPQGDPGGVGAQQAFHDLASAHLRYARQRRPARACPEERDRIGRWLPAFFCRRYG